MWTRRLRQRCRSPALRPPKHHMAGPGAGVRHWGWRRCLSSSGAGGGGAAAALGLVFALFPPRQRTQHAPEIQRHFNARARNHFRQLSNHAVSERADGRL